MAAFIGQLPWLILGLYGVLSLITYFIYGFDKTAAQNQRWRVAERTLHLLALLGGWPGALCAQQRYRHKSKKMAFLVVFWLTVLINCSVLAWFLFKPITM
ncbi:MULTISPECIES: DUF1294 domain-containing protein [unclassified Iodobacter]|uniref:DUF1294 domain-containing protein n=1 Tax=unclassified Iodobacter TaxID=235634 RepID=UPI0025F68C75|nr:MULTISPECIES: DUF1294 domain-containing protein [unclassified Iodobacter]MDW5419177.1 DUF1294 domain-containing protein [Iodobacter sp. CM08]